MRNSRFARASADDRLSTSRTRASRLSSDGVFANRVTAAAVTQFVLDHDEAARIEHVAAHFQLELEDVDAALRYYAQHGERLRASGEVVPER